MDRSKHYCNNCGNIGHLYRLTRRHPILSYGIILYDLIQSKTMSKLL